VSAGYRKVVKQVAKQLLVAAADAHAKGMSLTRSAARLEQLAEIATDEGVRELLIATLAEGLVEVGDDGQLRVEGAPATATASGRDESPVVQERTVSLTGKPDKSLS